MTFYNSTGIRKSQRIWYTKMTAKLTPVQMAMAEQQAELAGCLMEAQAAMSTMSLGADMDRRMIFLVGEVDEEMLYRFITVFKTMDQEEGPIAIFLASPGGGLHAGFAIYDTIRTAANPVVIQGTGLIMSMASIILQAGTLRFLSPETRVMVHNASLGIEGHLQGVSSAVTDTKYLNERMVAIVAERMKRPENYVKELFSNETYYSAKDAVDAGLADAVSQNRPLPANYEEAVAQLNAVLPDGYRLLTEAQLQAESAKKAPAKKAPAKKKGTKKKGK
jgi:ATP-dependent Clp protease protease subunit